MSSKQDRREAIRRYRGTEKGRLTTRTANTRYQQSVHGRAHRLSVWRTRKKHIDVLKYYMGGCVDCGYNEHYEALDFDHRPGENKEFNIARSKRRSWYAILKEMSKCDIVCANCHRVRSARRRKG